MFRQTMPSEIDHAGPRIHTHFEVINSYVPMVWVLSLVLALATAAVAPATPSSEQATEKFRTAKKSAAHVSSEETSKKPAHKTSKQAVSGSRARHQVRARGARRLRLPVPSYQLHPDPERYQQIQQALADKGYFKGEVNGRWGDDSVDALKRFQEDQKLPNDGKLNALTLIGLGLGPKHDGSTASAVPPPGDPEPPQTEPHRDPGIQPASPSSSSPHLPEMTGR